MIRRFLFVLAILLSALPVSSQATEKKYADWNEIAGEMVALLNESYEAYFQKDVERAKKLVNEAYFGFYEKEGFERTVMTYISGKRGAHVEYQFPVIKKLMTEGAPNKEVRAALDTLVKMLKEDANQLDGKEESGVGVFVAALGIILREGLEAILVIAAMAAYLTRSGNAARVRTVYCSAGLAIAASVAAAFVMQRILKTSGADQEIIEGVTMLLATVVLFFVSNWMFSKAEAAAWKGYIEDKVRNATETGSGFALGAAAFLAVFREGAETILFYQAMLSDVQSHAGMIWAGFGVGCVALAGVFAAVRYGSLRLPMKPFFIATSLLMYVMAIAFAGGGVKELQEGDVIGVTPVRFVQSIDLLGVYPTLETLLPQAVLVLLAIASVVHCRKKRQASR
jgi:high-affinity iron transporter